MPKRLVIIISAVFAFFLVSTAQAQRPERVSFEAFQLDIWPEYDHPDHNLVDPEELDPRALIIYMGRLSEDVTLPANITFRIPADVGVLNAVAVVPADGGMPLNATYEQRVDGEWLLVTMTATLPDILLEYYLPIDVNGSSRYFEYDWLGDFDVDWMAVQVQQPYAATDMRIEPDFADSYVSANDNLTYYRSEVGSPGYGDTFEIKISYTKNGNQLSKEYVAVRPTSPIDTGNGSLDRFASLLPWLIGGLGVLLLAGGGLWYWQMKKMEAQPAKTKRSRRSGVAIKSPEQISAENGGQGVFCHQCGKRAAAGDRFCRSCGTKLRS